MIEISPLAAKMVYVGNTGRPMRSKKAKLNAKVIARLKELGVGQLRYELQKLQNVRDLTNQDQLVDLGNGVSATRSEIDSWIKKRESWDRRKIWIAPLLTVVVIGIALFNVWLTTRANRPLLVSTNAVLFVNPVATPPEMVRITWGNMGKKSALRGTGTLFTVSDDGKRYQKVGVEEITAGNTTTLTPTFGYGYLEITVDMQKFLGSFLACIKYYDETNYSYRQHFLFRVGATSADHTVKKLDELPSEHQSCPRT